MSKNKSFVEKFRPLTHFEIVTGKPFRTRIGKSKYFYEHNLMSAVNLVRFHELYSPMLDALTTTAKATAESPQFNEHSVNLIKVFVQMIMLMYEVGKKPKWWWQRLGMKRAMLREWINDAEAMFKTFESLMVYESRLFSLARGLATWELVQTRQWKPMGSSKYATPSTRNLSHGFYSPSDMSYEKCKPYASMSSQN